MCGIRVDKCSSDRTRLRVEFSSGENSHPIISHMFCSVNCFIIGTYQFYFLDCARFVDLVLN